MIKVVYWTGTGNTGKMAECMIEGIKAQNKEVEVCEVVHAHLEDILSGDLIVLGCPSMGCEELEDREMEPFVQGLEECIQGKKVALFGSYGWGDGEWMHAWAERMTSAGAELVCEPLIVNEFTPGQDEEICRNYGKQIAG